MSLHPEDTLTHFIKKWICGIGIPLPLVAYGIISLIFQRSYLVYLRGPGPVFGEVSGFTALLGGMTFLGTGLVFFGHFFAPFSDVFCNWERSVQIVGLILFAIGFIGGHLMPLQG